MIYKVLIVDDSTFFRRRIKQILEEDTELEVVGEAKNGQEAISLVSTLKPDVVTMDIEMPIMDGITAVKRIMARNPLPIIMFSSLTHEGAQATLDALDAGALDFLPKKFEDIALNRKEAISLLQNRVKALGNNKVATSAPVLHKRTARPIQPVIRGEFKPSYVSTQQTNPSNTKLSSRYSLVAIGTSTGGPVALQKILTELPANFPVPVVMVQHMPGTFTHAFAKRLNDLCDIQVKEASHGEFLLPGVCYLAPGGKQMTIQGTGTQAKVIIAESERFPEAAYKPSVDVTFHSIAKVFSGGVLGIILTGMGADGKEGCRALKSSGAKIWAQDEKSSVVYGMPQAVTAANIAEANYDIAQMAGSIKKEILN